MNPTFSKLGLVMTSASLLLTLVACSGKTNSPSAAPETKERDLIVAERMGSLKESFLNCLAHERNGQIHCRDASDYGAIYRQLDNDIALEESGKVLSQGDVNTPIDKYAELSATALMFQYAALSGEPLNYEEMAETYSPEYHAERDGFKRADMMAQLKPALDEGVQKARSNHTYYMSIGCPCRFNIGAIFLNSYDMNRKLFEVKQYGKPYAPEHETFSPSLNKLSFNQMTPAKSIVLGNLHDYKILKIADESVARQIEAARKDGFGMKLYLYAQQAKGGEVLFHIVKADLLGNDGNTLATIAQ
ncbi:hypothetical protein OYT1_ch2479 [Ferriphaselus amnicola]|uniref:Lipoprotein n=1 Tax=Ferriphaselus amnicola TaxID=1188319 RepID=A0A2Z6GF43_9PROT|nr:hypothetical protein [Ferriphaselus amnicola]BBE51992.1 hypothetical protein OYT1_ch2479 [Ferriphaselus amnicola]